MYRTTEESIYTIRENDKKHLKKPTFSIKIIVKNTIKKHLENLKVPMNTWWALTGSNR